METASSKKKKDSGGAPAWVMTFADLMSILLSFFVLLLSFSEMDVAKYKQIAGSMREAFGVQRKYRVKEPPKGINVIAKEFSAGRPDPTPFNVMEQMTTDEMKRNLDTGDRRLQKSDGGERRSDSGKDDAERHRQDQSGKTGNQSADAEDRQKSGEEQLVVMPKLEAEELLRARERAERRRQLEQTSEQMRAALEEELQGGQLEIETEDEKIVIRIREKASFASGGVDLRDSFRPVLVRVAQILQKTSGEIAVVGHTDNVPLEQGLFRSNWDLSAARAVSVLHAMLESVRLDPARFSVQGAGDTQPLVENDTPAKRARNRRVEIILKQGEDLEAKTGIRSGLVPPEAAPAAQTESPAAGTDDKEAPGEGADTPGAGQDAFVQPAG